MASVVYYKQQILHIVCLYPIACLSNHFLFKSHCFFRAISILVYAEEQLILLRESVLVYENMKEVSSCLFHFGFTSIVLF